VDDVRRVLVALLVCAQGCSRARTYSLVPLQGLSAPVMATLGSDAEWRMGF